MESCKTYRFKVFLFLLIFLLLFTIPPVAATQYVSFAQPDTLTQKDIYLYNASGSLLGLYNTTSTGIEIPAAGDVMFVIKPQYSTPLDEPGTWLAATFAYVSTNLAALIIILFLIALLLSRK